MMEKLSDNDLQENKINSDETLATYVKYVDVDKYNTETNKQVGNSIRITGKLGQTIALALAIPKNYQPAGNYQVPTRFTFRKNHRNVIVVPVEHKKEVENISLTGKRTISYKIAEKDGTVKNLSDGAQNLNFEALKITDLLTGKVYYDWKNKHDDYSSVTSLVEEGYYANQQEAAGKKISITDLIAEKDKIDETVSVVYRPFGFVVQQDMEGNEISRTKYLNSSDPTKAAKMTLPTAPDGYEAVGELPQELAINDPGADIVFTYRPIEHDKYLHRVIRMITLVYWDGTKKIYPQEVDFVNENDKWKLAPGTKIKWNIVTPDIPEGYFISSVKLANGQDYKSVVRKTDQEIFAIDGIKPKFDTPNEDITVFIKPRLHKNYISVINSNSQRQEEIKRVEFSGRTGETVPININNIDIPEEYEVINKENIPSEYYFKAKYNVPVAIFVKRKYEKPSSMRIKLY